ncbi:MAG: hypothetical protein MUF84_11610 [Anaerolineae bacterium]|jgi:hypothetical protein|nr:hypothetical protein [Anaerolineae bacterium]
MNAELGHASKDNPTIRPIGQEARDMTAIVNQVRADWLKRHADKEGFARIEAMLVDIYAELFVNFHLRPRVEK